MKIHQQYTEDRIKLGELLEDFEIAMLTFVGTRDVLISQPMRPIEMDSEGALWFFTDITSEKAKHLDTLNLAFNGASDGLYISLSGEGEIDFDEDHKRALWSPYVQPWFPEGPASPTLGLLKFMPHTADYWETPSSSVVRLFAMAASIAASRPIGLGDHNRLHI